MFPASEIAALQARKQQLIAESEINRSLLALEWTQAKASLVWIRPLEEISRRLWPALVLAAPAAGYVLVHKWRRAGGWWRKAMLIWWIAQKVRKGMRLFAGRG